MTSRLVTSADDLALSIADAVHEFRVARGLSVASLAALSGVSRAMIAKIERREAQPTAVLLARLSGALNVTLSELITRAEGEDREVSHARQQPIWIDPDTGYRRRSLSPVPSGLLELTEVELPPGSSVSYPAATYAFAEQQLWMLRGRMRFTARGTVHELAAGDCLRRLRPSPSTYSNPGRGTCRYLIAMVTQRAMTNHDSSA